MDTAHAEWSDSRRCSLFTASLLSFPPPTFPQLEVRINKFSALPVVGLQACSTWLTSKQPLFIIAVFPSPFLSGIQLLPVFQTQCPQHTNHVTLRAPLDCVLAELKKTAQGESSLLHHHRGGSPNPEWRKTKWNSNYQYFFQDSAQRKLRTLADLNIWLIAVVFL